jgi:hypothetical protein
MTPPDPAGPSVLGDPTTNRPAGKVQLVNEAGHDTRSCHTSFKERSDINYRAGSQMK